MFKHVNDEHCGECDEVKFSWKVLKKHKKPLQRQIHEAVNISKKGQYENLNSKSEFNYQSVERLSLNKPKFSMTCKICGQLHRNKQEVENHEEKFHNRKLCSKCNYLSFGQRDLEEHDQNTHKNNSNINPIENS